MTNCKNCSSNFDSKYCPNCGVSAITKRIDREYILHEIQHGILHFESGFPYTTKELLTNPGHSIRSFILGDRLKHYKPIGYVLICSVIYSIFSHFLEIHTTKTHADNGYVTKLLLWIPEHFNYSNLIETIFIALTIKWFFKKQEFNYFENFILISYLTGFGMLIGSISTIIAYLTKIENINNFFPVLVLFYTVWGIGQFYKEQNWYTYLKALIAYLLGVFLFLFSFIILGELLNWVLKG